MYVNAGSEADVAVTGAESRTAVAVDATSVASEIPVRDTVVETAIEVVPVDDVAPRVITSAEVAAEAEETENELSVNAATATSAMRLKVVFVDICFLSIVELENLPSSA